MAIKSSKRTLLKNSVQGSTPLRKGEKIHSEVFNSHGRHKNNSHDSKNSREDALIDAIDLKRQIERLVPIFEKIDKGLLDVPGAASELSPALLKKVLQIALQGESEKNTLEAAKYVMALGGHSPVAKHAIAAVDASQPTEALIARVIGAKDILSKAGVVVVDDKETDSDEE